MQVYTMRGDDDHFYLTLAEGEDGQLLENKQAESLDLIWKPVRLRSHYVDDRHKELAESDFPNYLPDVPIFSDRAVEILNPLISSKGELLPVICNGRRFFFFNVTRVVNALDLENSVVRCFDDGRIAYFKEYAFHADVVAGESIFKIPVDYSEVFVTESFVDCVANANLRGLEFRYVWG